MTTTIDEEILTIIIDDTAPFCDRTQKVPANNLDLALDEQEIGGLRVYLVITRSRSIS
ncbi:hypothetical protein IQ264_03720 [Phormidium sp. LEGE 05292]|uniref:hypothetical protein n=1 Tax=[Phormidium] sp. LEGE 05292 TaxID=767427 RepID=UPI0018814CBF|nr:hypothetical protein [Phormidium sp. LEGE 05292]MBE9224581.1 hypothetical protein [Phormidium sp. LEGE 05292]